MLVAMNSRNSSLRARRIPLRRQFRLKISFPGWLGPIRSFHFRLMLPGLLIEYTENAPCPYKLALESGARIAVYNPLAEYDLGAMIELLPSFWDAVRTTYVLVDDRWIEVPDGWSGHYETSSDGWPRPVLG